MPLVLSLREGQDFFIAEERFVLLKIEGLDRFTIRSDAGRTHRINDRMAEEVVEDVFISSGLTTQAGVARIAIEAPPDVLILRGEKYRSGAQVEQKRSKYKIGATVQRFGTGADPRYGQRRGNK